MIRTKIAKEKEAQMEIEDKNDKKIHQENNYLKSINHNMQLVADKVYK